MTRSDAIDVLARHEVSQLAPARREALLLDWWSLDSDDPDYNRLPELVRAAIRRRDAPDDPQSLLYDPLLHLAIRRSLVGVVNVYLERRLFKLGHTVTVEGLAEVLEVCPCCGYLSLAERGGYEICQVCFWEDDGTANPESYSHPNRMTLTEARLNFERLGAVDEALLQYVLLDGCDRYARGER